MYKEIELPDDVQSYKIGTFIDCDYRLYRDNFFEDIRLEFINSNSKWSLMVSDNLFITAGESKRMLNVPMKHGDTYIIKYRESDNDVFSISFSIDFEKGKIEYNRQIFIQKSASMSIGATSDCQIQLSSEYLTEDKIKLLREGNSYILHIDYTTYDVRHNGNKAVHKEKINAGDFIALADFSFYIQEDAIWMEITDKCKIVGLEYRDYEKKNDYPQFVRNTRIKHILNDSEIEVLDPPSKPQKPKNNIFMNLLPSLGMLVAAGVMAYMGGTTMLIFSGMSAGMAVFTTVVGVFQGKKDYERESNTRIVEYNKYIQNKRIVIENYRKEELEELEKIYVSREVIKQRFEDFSKDLFDREATDEDFLHVCLGKGNVESVRKIKYKKQEKLSVDDELQELPQKICEDYKWLQDAPIICDYSKSNAIGVMGKKDFKFEILKANVLDICARQFYSDVKLFFVMDSKHENIAKMFRLLPYVNNTIPNNRNIVCDEDSKKIVFEFLYNELSKRKLDTEQNYVHYVIFFYDMCGFSSHPISKFIENAAEIGVTFVFFADDSSKIPQGCNYIIRQKDNDFAELIDSSDIANIKEFEYYKIPSEDIEKLNEFLAAVVSEEISLEGSLTKSIDLFKLLNILGVDDLNLKNRWRNSKVYKSMAVPLGVSKTGVVYLDLHDKAHGPHGLVAGTTGSGKSEILQSYILSIATYFHPYEVSFLIIDFKGGGMVNQFKKLPHLLGAITNIDGKEIDRSLKSIKAELQKRQKLFAEAEVNHIDKYIQKYKNEGNLTPLPHLIIIVDEFAELKAEQPEFMKELISAARIGRSLGVHLILATQKPSGQVDDQIWSNSRFKLCLKVQDQQDSNEVLKSPLAAEIKEPGRAYLQVGNNEIFELFQSAYSGAPEKKDTDVVKEFSISELSSSGRRTIIFEQKNKRINDTNRTQLEAIVEYVNKYVRKNNIEKLSEICLPSLPNIIVQPNELVKNNAGIDIGIYDDPDNQIQASMYIDVDSKNTLIIGSSQYGKTNLLESIIKSIASSAGPRAYSIYILDFASMVLKNFEKLNHVGGVVTSSEDEKLKNFFKLIYKEISSRKERLLAVGVSSFSSYLEAGYTDLAHIYIIIDNFTALSELYLQDDDSLLEIIREGISVGISAIVSNAQLLGIGYRYTSNFANKIAFYCNDADEYLSLFDHVYIKPDEKAGRCVLELDKKMVECQTYLAFDGEKEIVRIQQMREFINEINSKYPSEKAKQIPSIPNVLSKNMLWEENEINTENTLIPIGLTYDEVKIFYIDLHKIGIMGICGKEGFGHKNIIYYIIDILLERKSNNAHIVVFDDINKGYAKYKDIVEFYSLGTDPIFDVIKEWHKELERRYNQMMIGDENEDTDLLLMIVQNNDVAQKIQEDIETLNKFNEIISTYKHMGICILFTNYPNKAISFDAPDAIRVIRQSQHIIYLDDLQNLKCFDPPYEAVRKYKKQISLGDGYYINDNEVTKIKIVHSKN